MYVDTRSIDYIYIYILRIVYIYSICPPLSECATIFLAAWDVLEYDMSNERKNEPSHGESFFGVQNQRKGEMTCSHRCPNEACPAPAKTPALLCSDVEVNVD